MVVLPKRQGARQDLIQSGTTYPSICMYAFVLQLSHNLNRFTLTNSDVGKSSIIKICIFRRPALSFPKREPILMGEVSFSIEQFFTGGCDRIGAHAWDVVHIYVSNNNNPCWFSELLLTFDLQKCASRKRRGKHGSLMVHLQVIHPPHC